MSAPPVSIKTETVQPAPKRRRRWLIWLRRSAITILVIVIALIYVVFPLWASSLVTRAFVRSVAP